VSYTRLGYEPALIPTKPRYPNTKEFILTFKRPEIPLPSWKGPPIMVDLDEDQSTGNTFLNVQLEHTVEDDDRSLFEFGVRPRHRNKSNRIYVRNDEDKFVYICVFEHFVRMYTMYKQPTSRMKRQRWYAMHHKHHSIRKQILKRISIVEKMTISNNPSSFKVPANFKFLVKPLRYIVNRLDNRMEVILAESVPTFPYWNYRDDVISLSLARAEKSLAKRRLRYATLGDNVAEMLLQIGDLDNSYEFFQRS